MRLGKGVPVIAPLGGAASLRLGPRDIAPSSLVNYRGLWGHRLTRLRAKSAAGNEGAGFLSAGSLHPRAPQETPLPRPGHTSYY